MCVLTITKDISLPNFSALNSNECVSLLLSCKQAAFFYSKIKATAIIMLTDLFYRLLNIKLINYNIAHK
jgi:hypothetical protein